MNATVLIVIGGLIQGVYRNLRRRAMQPVHPPDGVRIGKPAPARAEVVECLEE